MLSGEKENRELVENFVEIWIEIYVIFVIYINLSYKKLNKWNKNNYDNPNQLQSVPWI